MAGLALQTTKQWVLSSENRARCIQCAGTDSCSSTSNGSLKHSFDLQGCLLIGNVGSHSVHTMLYAQ
jgi:hypothetical protein